MKSPVVRYLFNFSKRIVMILKTIFIYILGFLFSALLTFGAFWLLSFFDIQNLIKGFACGLCWFASRNLLVNLFLKN